MPAQYSFFTYVLLRTLDFIPGSNGPLKGDICQSLLQPGVARAVHGSHWDFHKKALLGELTQLEGHDLVTFVLSFLRIGSRTWT